MAALCEAPLERQLKPLFRVCSAFVRDNGAVKNTSHCACLPLALRTQALCALLAVSALGWHGGAGASDKGDHERARQAVQSGQVMPLSKVLANIERDHPGQVLEVELESRDRQWQYEIKLLKPDGRLSKLKIDARTGALLEQKTR